MVKQEFNLKTGRQKGTDERREGWTGRNVGRQAGLSTDLGLGLHKQSGYDFAFDLLVLFLPNLSMTYCS